MWRSCEIKTSRILIIIYAILRITNPRFYVLSNIAFCKKLLLGSLIIRCDDIHDVNLAFPTLATVAREAYCAIGAVDGLIDASDSWGTTLHEHLRGPLIFT